MSMELADRMNSMEGRASPREERGRTSATATTCRRADARRRLLWGALRGGEWLQERTQGV